MLVVNYILNTILDNGFKDPDTNILGADRFFKLKFLISTFLYHSFITNA